MSSVPSMNNARGIYDGTANFPGWFIANDWPVLPLRHITINYRPSTFIYPPDDHPAGPTLTGDELRMLFLMLRRVRHVLLVIWSPYLSDREGAPS